MIGLTLSDALEHLFRFGRLEPEIAKALSPSHRARLRELIEALESCGAATVRNEEVLLLNPLKALEVARLFGVDISRLLPFVDWSEFEDFVAEVLREEGFEAFRDVKRTSISRFQIDVLGIDPSKGVGLVIECKRWRRVLSSMARLAEAARSHVERVRKLVKVCEWVCVSIPLLRRAKVLIPVIVTLAQPPIPVVEGVPVVSVATLRDFLRNAVDYVEELGVERIENRCFVGKR